MARNQLMMASCMSLRGVSKRVQQSASDTSPLNADPTSLEGVSSANASQAQALAANGKVLAFSDTPPLATIVNYRRQPYTLSSCEPYRRVDGSETLILKWQAPCWECGKPFEFSAPLSGTKWPSRRCQDHRRPGVRCREAGRTGRARA